MWWRRPGCPVVLMHSPDPAKGPHGGVGYGDVLTEVFDWLEARVAAVVAGGVDRAKIIVDPGIGFGKSLADNLALLNGLAMFHGLGCPIMLGASRKRMIGALSNEAPADQRLGGTSRWRSRVPKPACSCSASMTWRRRYRR